MSDFVNPYHFVPLGSGPLPTDGVRRDQATWRPHLTHDRYVAGTHSGRIVCRLTTETPLVVGSTRTPAGDGQPSVVEPYRGPDDRPAIPASTIRGLISAVYEAATNSALRVLTDVLYSVRVPAEPGKPLPFLGMLVKGGIQKLDLQARHKVKGYQKRAADELEIDPNSYLATTNPDSTSSDHRGSWFVPKTGHPANATPTPSRSHKTDTEGVLRVLGIEGREKKLPMGRIQELFVPLGDDDTIYEIAPGALDTFYTLADQRTEEDPDLPFQVKGAKRNAGGNDSDHSLRLRPGDLVFFRTAPDERGREVVTELAVSQIWRREVGQSFEYFRAISKELLPMGPERETITLAEQVFGFVESIPKDHPDNRQGQALASRLRFSEARLAAGQDREFFRYDGAGKPRSFVLKELSTPKPPCPALYFTAGDNRLIPKTGLRPGDHRPQGRKFYVHHPVDPNTPHWETHDPDAGARERKSEVTPLRSGLTFEFHIDFDNLTDRELGFLLYTLRPSPAFRHTLGMGKPLGLGRSQIDLGEVSRIDRTKRYAEDDPFAGPRFHTTAAGTPWVATLVAAVRGDVGLQAQVRAVEQIGDPAGTQGAAVHYPQVANKAPGTVEFEQELYEWFVANEKHANPSQRRPLPPLTGSGRLPKLPRHNRHQGQGN